MKTVTIMITCIALSGCDGRKSATQQADAQRARHEAAAKTMLVVSAPLKPRVLQAGEHQLVVIDVPSVAMDTFVQTQRCYVWRDAEFKTATMSCPGGDTGIDLGSEHNANR